MKYTSRLHLSKPESTDDVNVSVLSDNFQTIDDNINVTVCTSSTRPSQPFNGQQILESNTGLMYVYDQTLADWRQTSGITVNGQTGPVQFRYGDTVGLTNGTGDIASSPGFTTLLAFFAWNNDASARGPLIIGNNRLAWPTVNQFVNVRCYDGANNGGTVNNLAVRFAWLAIGIP